MDSEKAINTLSGNTYVRLGAVIAVLVGIITFVIKEVEYRTNLQRDLEQLTVNIQKLTKQIEKIDNKVVGKSPEGWHRPDMKLWILETERENPNWRGADAYPK
jgi:hypothetical protein